MKRHELQAEFDRLTHQIAEIRENVGKVSDDLIALSSQQVCVSICGSLEQCIKRIFMEYSRRRSNSQIFRPIEKVCESYQNPKTTKILELIGLFDRDYEIELQGYWETENEIERDHLNNLVDDRITIAHRKKTHINVSTGKLTNYYTAYSNLLDRLYAKFLD